MSDTELTFRNQENYISKYRRMLEYFDAVKTTAPCSPAPVRRFGLSRRSLPLGAARSPPPMRRRVHHEHVLGFPNVRVTAAGPLSHECGRQWPPSGSVVARIRRSGRGIVLALVSAAGLGSPWVTMAIIVCENPPLPPGTVTTKVWSAVAAIASTEKNKTQSGNKSFICSQNLPKRIRGHVLASR